MRVWLLLLVLAAPSVSLSAPVAVRSGEHADFSRLVVYYDATTGWTFSPEDGGYVLRPDVAGTSYDLSRIWDLIPRDRIADVVVRPDGTLFLSVDCACHAEAFEHQGKVVVDVKDGTKAPAAAPPGPKAEVTLNEPSTESVELPGSFRDMPPPYRPIGSRLAPGELTHSARLAVHAPLTVPSDLLAGDPADNSIAETRSNLVAQIARAASDGLISPNIALPTGNGPEMPPGQTAAARDSPPAPDPPPDLSGPNIRIETAIQRGELASAPPGPVNERGDACLPSSDFDISAWGQPPDQGSAIANYRSGLIGEFDAADPQSLAALARHYIYLTFGAEAISLIRSFDGQIEKAALLTMLAEIMDDGRSAAMPAIAAQVTCDSASALWAILATPSLRLGSGVSPTAVLSAFSSLPLHLRRHLGPGLAERFLDVGDTESAATIRNLITRAPGKPGSGVQMMEAEIALALGNHDAGIDQLAEVINDNGPLVPEAVITLIDAGIATGDIPDPVLIETASVLAFEARGSADGARLKLASLRGQLHRGAFAEAMEELNASVTPYAISASQAADLKREAIGLVSENGTDAQFLQLVYREPLRLGPGEGADDMRRRVAGRLLDLGFAQSARDVLSDDPDVPTRDDRLLYARSFVDQKRPDLAIGYLAGLTTAAAVELRAQAHHQAREFDRAGALYADLGQAENSARVAWQGQLLETVAQIGTEAQAEAAKLRSKAVPDANSQGEVTLAESERILQESRNARQILAALLTETGKP